MLITHCYESNAILVRPLRSRKGSELSETEQETRKCLAERGYKPNYQILDNKNPSTLKECFKQAKITFQLAPLRAR